MKKLLHLFAFVWVLQWFNTADDLVAFLNRLPADRQAEASIITAPSTRNFGGLFGSPYGLVYRK